MKINFLFILTILLLASCNSNNSPSQPLVFSVRLDVNRPYYLDLIMGSDTQTVDSLYKVEFNRMVSYASYYYGDTLGVEDIISKLYSPEDLVLKVNNYINQNRSKENSCDSFMITTNCMIVTYNKNNKKVSTCMRRSDLRPFLEELLNELKQESLADGKSRIFLRHLNALCDSTTFSHTIEQP